MKPSEQPAGTEWSPEDIEVLQYGMRRYELYFPRQPLPSLPEPHETGELVLDIPSSVAVAGLFDALATRTEDYIARDLEPKHHAVARGARPRGGRKFPQEVLQAELDRARSSLKQDRDMATEILAHARTSRRMAQNRTAQR